MADFEFTGVAGGDGPTTPEGEAPVNDGVALPTSSTAPVLSPTSQQTFGQALTYGLPGLGIGLIDTMGQSLHVIHNDTIPNMLNSVTGDQEGSLGDFYSHNQVPLRTGGELGGMLLPGMVAIKALKSINGLREAGQLGNIAKSSKYLDWLLGSSADLAASQGRIVQGTKDAIVEQGIWAGKTVSTPAVVAAKRGYYAKQAIDAARTTTAFEMGNYAAFNSSQTFYPADTTVWDQAKWVAGGYAVGLGLEMAAARYSIRQLVQSATRSDRPAILGGAGEAPAFMDWALAGGPAKDADKIMFRPAQRGVGLTAYAGMNADLNETLKVSNNPATLKTNLTQDQVNIKKVMTEQLGQMAYDTHPLIPRTKLDQGQIDLGIKALGDNPTSFLYAKKLAQLPEDSEEFYKSLTEANDKAKKSIDTASILADLEPDFDKQRDIMSKAYTIAQPVIDAANEMHYVIEPTGDWTVYKNRADNWLDTNSLSDIKRKPYLETDPADIDNKLKRTKLLAQGTNPITLHDDFRIEMPKTPTPMDFSTMYAMGSKLIKEWKPVEGQKFILTPQVNWRTLEMNSALAKANPQAAQAVTLSPEFGSLDDVDFHVLNQKFKEFNKLMPDTATKPIAPSTSLLSRIGSLGQNFTPAQVIQRLNLPVPSGFQQSPLLETFAQAKLQGMKDLNEMFPRPKGSDGFSEPYSQLDLLKQHLRETSGVTDPKTEIPVQGKLLQQTSDTAPIFVAAKSTPHLSLADANIQTRVQAMRDVQLQRLSQIDPNKSPLVAGVIQKIVSAGRDGGNLSGEANTARGVQTLQDGVLSGTGQIVYQDRINEQFPTLKAAQLMAQNTDKWVDNYVATLAASSLTPKYATMLGSKSRNDLLDFNRIEQAYRHGWEVQGPGPAAKIGGGSAAGYSFPLEPDSKINAQLKALHFPDVEADEIGHLPDMSVTAKKNGYQPLVVSTPAGDLAKAISDMSIRSGVENNSLRTALGKNPIQLRNFHLPTPELNKEGTWFVRNPTGDVIQTYPGANVKENERRAKEAATVLGDGHIAIPLDTVKRDHQINDDNFFSIINYSDQLAKTGAGIKGGLAKSEIDTGPNTLKAMISSLQEQFLNVGVRSRTAIFEPELNYARQAGDTASLATKNNSGGINIFDRYLSTMFSQSPAYTEGFKPIYGKLQSGMDRTLSWLYQYYNDISDNLGNKMGAKVMRTMLRKSSSEEEFAQFQKTLPGWSPFKDAEAWRESTFKEKSPITSRELSSDLARLSSTMSLRFLDNGTVINNLAGLMTNAPSVTYGLRKLPGENVHDWIDRTAAWGSNYVDGVSTFNPNKAMVTTIKRFWNGELTAPMADAASHGYFEPEYASLAKALTMPTTPGMQTLAKWTKAASWMADNSEILSRKLAWGMGYSIGKDLHQFDDEKNAYTFANNFVNEMIGNYSPNNKPAMFQGAVGLPLGAFQTYMFNFYRRLYGNIERGDKASVMAQYAAQASIFGVRSVPGYALWNNVFQSNNIGDDDFTGRVRRNLPPGVGELLLDGSISNVPKIWGGMQADGVAFYGRGSVDFTQPPPTLLDASKAPPIQFLANVAKGINETAKNVMQGFSLQQQEEILANMSTNRAFKSIMEMAADAKTSDQGLVIQQGTRDAIHIAAGLLGTQPNSTRALTEAYSRNRNVQLAQEDLFATLTAHTRAVLRGGDFTTDDLQGMVNTYIQNHGNPAALGQWFRNTIMSSTEPRTTKQLNALANSGKLLEFEDMLATLQQAQPSNAKENK